MNVDIIWQGTSIKDHTIEYTRQHDICTGIGSLDLIVEGKTTFDFNPWNQIVIREEGNQVAIYNITSVEKTSPGGTYIIAAQDNSKRLTDYFIDREYTTEDITYTRYWIELILSDAGVVSYNFNTTSQGQGITIGSQFGMRSAYDAIINLLQLSGWYMYFDENGTCQIGELDTNKNPIHIYNTDDVLKARTTYSDKNLRNRVYVWGTYDEHNGWVHAEAETYLPWFRDDGEDWRSIVYQNSYILYYSTAIKMASRILSEFSKQIPEREIQVVGLNSNIRVGRYVTINSTYGGGNGQITSFIVNVNSGGATTTLLLDKRCPRLFGISDLKAEFIYVGTKGFGVWRKVLDSGYWYAYNTGIANKTIVDLTAYDGLVSTVTNSGELFINDNGNGWLPVTIPTGIADQSPTTSGILITSGNFVAVSTDRIFGQFGGIVSTFSHTYASGFTFDDSTMPIYPASGNRSWVTEYAPDGTLIYSQQIHYATSGTIVPSGMGYDVGVLDVETDDLGKNVLSIVTTDKRNYGFGDIGSYGFLHQSYYWKKVIGRNINNFLPPPTDGIYIKGTDWGNSFSIPSISPNQRPVNIEWLASGVRTLTCTGQTGYTPFYISILERYNLYAGGFEPNYYGIDSTFEQALGVDTTACKIVKMDDYLYSIIYPWHLLICNVYDDTIQDIQLPDVYINGNLVNEELNSSYGEWNFGGNDGDWFVYTQYNTNFGEHSGGGYVRVVNMKTGAYYTHEISYPDQIPLSNGHIYYRVERIGVEETPNHVIVVYCATPLSAIGTIKTEQMPTTIIESFIIDKYTGATNRGFYELEWDIKSSEAWNCEHGLMQCSSHSLYGFQDHEEWIHAPPFVACMSESIENKGGYGLIHLTSTHAGLKWLYLNGDLFGNPPRWGWGYFGTFYQCVNLRIEIPSANMYTISQFLDYHIGNSDVTPIIPVEDFHDSVPTWCLTPFFWDLEFAHTSISSTHSRNTTATPVIWRYYRVNPDSYTGPNDVGLAFTNPANPAEYVILTQPPGLYVGGGTQNDSVSTVSPLLDAIDNDIYISIASGEGVICGYDYGGNLNKMWDGNRNYDFINGGFPLANGVAYWDYGWKTFLNWPGSGITYSGRMYKVLYHDPVVPSGLFTVIGEYSRPLSLEVGLGLPLVVYDAVQSGWFNGTTILAVNYTPSGASWQSKFPGINIENARLFDVFGGVTFPLESGESIPPNSFNRYIGVAGEDKVVMFNTDFVNNPSNYSTIATFSGGRVTYVDFTNYFASPYIFTSVITVSGQKFFQRHTGGSYFYNYSYGLPSGVITIIRADDRI